MTDWPELPVDADFDVVVRHANVRMGAEYFLKFDKEAKLPAELRLSPEAAWELAEKTYDKLEQR